VKSKLKVMPSLLSLAASMGLATPSMAATPLSSTTVSFAGMIFGAGNTGNHGVTSIDGWGKSNPMKAPLTSIGNRATSTVTVAGPEGSGDDTTTSTATAKWTDADHGNFHVVETYVAQFGDLSGVDFANDVPGRFGLATGRDFDYNFTATADGMLTLSSTILAFGDTPLGLGDWDAALVENPLDENGDFDPPTLFDGFHGTDALRSTLQFHLTKGKTYSLEIFNRESDALVSSGFEDANFDFSITDDPTAPGGSGGTGGAGAVPEPASWAMMLGGFGLVGVTMRRRRKLAVSFS